MIRKLFIICAIGAFACVAAPQIWYPFGFDQMVYAACGDVIRRGGVPIRDCFETKQMGVMVMYALPMIISQTAWAIHLFTLVWQAVTAVIIARIAINMFGVRAGWVAGTLYWLIYAGINYWSMDQAETFSNVFLVLAFWWLFGNHAAQGQSGVRNAIFAGICIGIAFWFKYIFALVGIALGVLLLLKQVVFQTKQSPLSFASKLRLPIVYALSTLTVVLLGIGFYAMQTDGLYTLLTQLNFLRENFPLAEPLPLSGMAQMMLRFFDNGADISGGHKATLIADTLAATILGGGFPFALLLCGIGLVRACVPRFSQKRGWQLAGLVIYLTTSMVICIWQGNYIQYHYSLMHVPVALLAASAFANEGVPMGWRRGYSFIVTPVFIIAIGLLVLRMLPILSDTFNNVLIQRKPMREIYLESKQGAHIPVGEYLREKTTPQESIAIFGDAPWVYTLANRPNATRFSFVNVWIKKRNTPSYALYVQQFREGLARNKPLYIVLTKANFPWDNNDYVQDYKLATPIYDYVEANYAYEGENGPFLLFRRR